MHEYSLMLALMERVEAEAASRRALAVHRIRLRIGELSGVEPELLEGAFAIVRMGTISERASLEIERVAAQWACGSCQRSLASGDRLRCPACGSPAELKGGDEILLGQLELEVP